MRKITDEEIARIADEDLAINLRCGEFDRITGGRRSKDDIARELALLDRILSTFREYLVSNDLDSVSDTADHIISWFKLPIEKGSLEYLKLSRQILIRNVRWLEIEIQKIKGRYPAESLALTSKPALPGQHAAAKPGRTLAKLISDFISEKTSAGDWASRTIRSQRSGLDLFLEFAGDIPAAEITRALVVEYRDKFLKVIPKNRSKFRKYAGKNIEQLAKMRIGAEQRLDTRTINERISILSGFLSWCELNDYLDRNPARSLQIRDRTPEHLFKEAYSREELQKMILGVLKFRKSTPNRFWIPLISMLSGLRQNEAAQLHLSDIAEVEGIPCFIVASDSEDKSVKTRSGERNVPIHPALIDAGLLKYADRLRKRNGKRLFPELTLFRDSYGQRFGKWFGLFNRQHVTDNPKRSFHSLRHGFADKLKQARVETTIVEALLGHKHRSISLDRYGKPYAIETLLEAVSKVDYGIHLSKMLGEG